MYFNTEHSVQYQVTEQAERRPMIELTQISKRYGRTAALQLNVG